MAEPAFKRKARPKKTSAPAAPVSIEGTRERHSEPTRRPDAGTLGPFYAYAPSYNLLANQNAGDEAVGRESVGPRRDGDLAERATRDPGPGQALDPVLRQKLEHRFQRDLRHIRVHTGSTAEEASADLGAAAFAHRHHIWLATPESTGDTALLAHEITHVVQQGAAPPLRLAEPSAPAGGAEAISHTAAPTATGAAPAVQTFDIWGAANRVGSAVSSGIRSAAGTVVDVAGDVLSWGRDRLLGLVRRIAPDFIPLFQGGGIARFLRRLIGRGMEALFGGVLGPLRAALDFGRLGARFGEAAQWFSTIAGQLANNDCSGILEAARRVGAFFSEMLRPVVDWIKETAASVADLLSSIWDAVGAPIMDLLRRIGGSIWEGLRGFIREAGRLIRRVRSALGAAWGRVKDYLGIEAEDGESEGGGLWNWIKDKAADLWESAKATLAPITGPLRTVGGILLVLVPGGQLVLVMALWPRIKQAFDWIGEKWTDLNLVVRAREFLANTALPALVEAITSASEFLIAGADWLLGLLDRVSTTVDRAARSLGGVFAILGRLIRLAAEKFRGVVEWARRGLQYVARNAGSMVRRLVEFVQKVIEGLKKVIAIVVNPFGIPGFLLGSLWRALPECLKGPIIDFIVTVLIRFIRAIPSSAILGFLWPLVRGAILGFLERIQSFATARKVAISNKVAKIISGRSFDFAIGYLKGLFLGLIDEIVWPFQLLATMFELPGKIRGFLETIGLRFCEILEQIRCFAATIGERALGTLDELIASVRDLLENPQQIVELLRCAIEGLISGAHSLGARLAEGVIEAFEAAEEQIGEQVGRLTSTVLVQAVLAFFTAGSSTALAALRPLVQALRTVGQNAMRIVRVVIRQIPRILGFIKKLGRTFARAGSRAAGKLGGIGGFFRRVVAWFRRLLHRLTRWFRRRRGGLSARDRLLWRQFRSTLRARLAPHQRDGIEKRPLRNIFRDVRRPFRQVVRGPLLIGEDGPRWILRTFRKGSLRPRRVARVLMDWRIRWRRTKRELERELRDLKRRHRGLLDETDIRRVTQPIAERYRYRNVRVAFDEGEDAFVIEGTINPPKKKKTKQKRPPRNAFEPPTGSDAGSFKKMAAAYLVEARTTRTSPTRRPDVPAQWPYVGQIRRIRTRCIDLGGWLYVKGHLISGFFAGGGPENLTPITQRANQAMEAMHERYLWSELPFRLQPNKSGKPVFRYEVEATGRRSTQPPLRSCFPPGITRSQVRQSEKSLFSTIKLTIYRLGGKSWNKRTKISGLPDRIPNAYPRQ